MASIKTKVDSPEQADRDRSPSEGDPAIRRQLSSEHFKHINTAHSLREIIKNLVHDTFGVTVVGLKRLSAFKDVNFVLDGILPSLKSVEEQPSTNGDTDHVGSAAAAQGGDADSGHKHAQRTHSSQRRHHPGSQQPTQKFLLKMLNEEESGKEAMINLVDGQTTLARHLHARGFPTHVPMPSKSGALFELLPVPFAELLLYHIDKTTDHESVMVTLSNSLVRLFPYLPGVPLADVPDLGEHELHDVGAVLAMMHNAIVEDDFDHSAYRFWSSYLDDADFEDGDEDRDCNIGMAPRSQSNVSTKSFKQLVKRRMSKDEANRVMPFWSFDKVAEGRDAGETYVFRQNRKRILKEAFDRCEEVLLNKDLLKTLPKAAVHGDFNPWNLLVDQPNSTPRTSTSSDSISWGVAASATELAPQVAAQRAAAAESGKKNRVDSLCSPPPVLTAPLTLGRYKLNGIIDFGESHYTFLIFDIAIAMSSMLDVMYSRHFQHPSTPESSAISSVKPYDFSPAAVHAASASQRAALEAAAVEPRDETKADAAIPENDPMFAEASRKVEKWFNCLLAGYETKRPLRQEERDAVVPLILGWEAMAIALSKKELAKQPENRYVQGFCNDQDWRRLSWFLKIFPAVEAKANGGKRRSTSPTTPTATAAAAVQQKPQFD